MIITILGSNSVPEIYDQGHGIINYVLKKWDKETYAIRNWDPASSRSTVDYFVKMLRETIPEATIDYIREPMSITINIPDHVYTLTQLKYSEHINEDY